jgi:DNA-binding NarL/FixJ family response regulator
MIRVLVCDDQLIVCEGLKAILKTAPGIEVIGTAQNGAQALEMAAHQPPDIVLMDLKMPVMNGIKATREMRSRFAQIKVLVLTTYDADDWVFDAIRSGASGYLLKDTPRDELIAAIEGTIMGDTFVSPRVATRLFARVAQSAEPSESFAIHTLSEREREVLALIARGFTNSDIADRLHLSTGTVRNYVSIILDKLNVSDRTQAAILALSSGFIDLNAMNDP